MRENENQNDVIEIDLRDLFGLIIHKLWIIVLCGIAVGVVAFCLSAFVIAPKYESTTGIYILNKQNGNSISYSDAQLATQLTKDYEELITCRYVLETVIEKCELEDDYEDLKDRVSVKNASDTRIIYITVKDKVPAMAQFIANSIREVASTHIKSVTDVEAVNVVDQANLPVEAAEPSIPKFTLIGILLGMFISAGVVVIKYLMDDTIKTADDVEKYLGLSTLALIPVIDTETKDPSGPIKPVAPVEKRPQTSEETPLDKIPVVKNNKTNSKDSINVMDIDEM